MKYETPAMKAARIINKSIKVTPETMYENLFDMFCNDVQELPIEKNRILVCSAHTDSLNHEELLQELERAICKNVIYDQKRWVDSFANGFYRFYETFDGQWYRAHTVSIPLPSENARRINDGKNDVQSIIKRDLDKGETKSDASCFVFLEKERKITPKKIRELLSIYLPPGARPYRVSPFSDGNFSERVTVTYISPEELKRGRTVPCAVIYGKYLRAEFPGGSFGHTNIDDTSPTAYILNSFGMDVPDSIRTPRQYIVHLGEMWGIPVIDGRDKSSKEIAAEVKKGIEGLPDVAKRRAAAYHTHVERA